MIEKLKSELIKKYSGQARKEYLESLAERLADKVEKEEDIQGVLSELENSPIKIGDLQTEGDRRVATIKKELEELKRKKPEPPPPPKPDEGDVAAQIAELKREILEERKERQRQAARAALMERTRDKQIPKALLDDISINTVEEVESTVERLIEKTEALKKEWGGISGQEPPKKGDIGSNRKQVVDDLMKFKPT